MKVLVIGASGGSGRAALSALSSAGNEVYGMCRRPEALADLAPQIMAVRGDASVPADVDSAVEGVDAVVVTLGISENPVMVRVRGTRHTPIDVRSRGTLHAIAAMRQHGVRRLIVQTTYGIGETKGRLTLSERLFFGVLLKPQIADTVVQERAVRDSQLDWTLIQPVHLSDEVDGEAPFVSPDGQLGQRKVSRTQVGMAIAGTLTDPSTIGASLAVSAAL